MADSDLPPPRISDADAQATPVVRLPAFLSPEEIAEIDAFIARFVADMWGEACEIAANVSRHDHKLPKVGPKVGPKH